MSKPVSVVVKKSTNPEKKLMAIFTMKDDSELTRHFGAAGMTDYTQHKEEKRMKRYLNRHRKNENWNDPLTAGALSRWILWNKPDFKASFKDFCKRFNLKGELKTKTSIKRAPKSNPVEMIEGKPVDITTNTFTTIYRASRTFDKDKKGNRILRYPKNMQKAAETITGQKGAKIRAGIKKGQWMIQAVLIPRKAGLTKKNAVKLSDKVIRRFEPDSVPSTMRRNPAKANPAPLAVAKGVKMVADLNLDKPFTKMQGKIIDKASKSKVGKVASIPMKAQKKITEKTMDVARAVPVKNPKMACPLSTQDLETNTRNRNNAIQADYIKYGPLNLADTDGVAKYYEDAAEFWNTDVESAKQSKCSNCVAFDISPRMLDCMPGPVSEPIEDEDGYLGYCWMHHFKCHSARTCYTWAAGGPISKDKISHEWQERAFGKDKIAPEPKTEAAIANPDGHRNLKEFTKEEIEKEFRQYENFGWMLAPDYNAIGIQIEMNTTEASIALVNAIVGIAMEINHSPTLEWDMPVGVVRVICMTWSTGSLTNQDLKMVARITDYLNNQSTRVIQVPDDPSDSFDGSFKEDNI